MQKRLFITIFLVIFIWGGVAFGSDSCPNVTGLWETTYKQVRYDPPGLPSFGSTPVLPMAIHAQDGCSFYGSFLNEFIIVVGVLRKLSLTQYAVTMQIVSDEMQQFTGPLVIEGTLNCTTSSSNLKVYPSTTQPVCNTMSTSFHGYYRNPLDPSDFTSVAGNMNLSKQ